MGGIALLGNNPFTHRAQPMVRRHCNCLNGSGVYFSVNRMPFIMAFILLFGMPTEDEGSLTWKTQQKVIAKPTSRVPQCTEAVCVLSCLSGYSP